MKNTAVVSTIVPVQPFGYNFLGGKLIACLTTLGSVRDVWEKRYNDKLVGLTTTSLYGSFSMYNSIPLWKKVGESKGNVYLVPDDEIYKFWMHWLKKHHREQFDMVTSSDKNKIKIKTGPKQNILNLIFRYLGLNPKDYLHEHFRGVYFSPLYKNTKDFLKGKIEETELILDTKTEKGLDYILEWWKKAGSLLTLPMTSHIDVIQKLFRRFWWKIL